MRIVNDKLLALFRGPKCEFCWDYNALQCHHVYPRGGGRLDIRENLVCLCLQIGRAHV